MVRARADVDLSNASTMDHPGRMPAMVGRRHRAGSRATGGMFGLPTYIGLDSSAYGTHSLRRTKAALVYHRTKNLRAVQLLLGHTKLQSTVRYLGIEVYDAVEVAEQTDA